MNLNPTTTHPSSSPFSSCGNCGTQEKFLLHNVRLRGIHRRLCTSCVLLLHPTSFCPSCFTFYDSSPPPPSKRLSCSNCSSFTHSHCSPSSSSSSPFLCPPCSNPKFTFFDINSTNRAIDKTMASVLLCAARIASSSMAKALVVARAEAERRVREASLCRKRAREALEHVGFLVSKRERAMSMRMMTTTTTTMKEAAAVQVSGCGSLGKVENDNEDLGLESDVNGYSNGERKPASSLQDKAIIRNSDGGNVVVEVKEEVGGGIDSS